MTTKNNNLIIYILIAIQLATNLAICGVLINRRLNSRVEAENRTTPANLEDLRGVEVVFESTPELIERLALEKGFNVKTALKIAECESQYGKFKFNPSSSAKGIYQFTDRTWKNYCAGDVLNDYDNIYCFIKLYNAHPTWWECKI